MNGQKIILIVDDVPENIKVLASTLRDKYRLIFATHGRKALELAMNDRRPPDLILLDIMMPEIDGYEVCRRLKADERTLSIPLIFVTALDEDQDQAKGLELGAVDYITKPFNPAIVKARVRTQLELKDTTDRLHHYNEELEQLVAEETRKLIRVERQAAFGELIQGIVHNLKDPLTVIMGSAELGKDLIEKLGRLIVEKDPRQVEDLVGLINRIHTSQEDVIKGTDRLTDMVESFTTRSKADQGLATETFDLNVIVQEELNFLKGDLHFKHKITKDIDLSPKPLPVCGIPSEIAQMFTNLIRNAIDALHGLPDQKISVITRSNGKNAILQVRDTGCGIAPDHLEKVFDPFFSMKPKAGSSETTSDRPAGTGLGLYVCQRTIEILGGEISAQSEPEKGTTFQVKIPLAT